MYTHIKVSIQLREAKLTGDDPLFAVGLLALLSLFVRFSHGLSDAQSGGQ